MTTTGPRATWSRRLLTGAAALAVVCAFAATTALVAERNLASAASALLLALVAGAAAGTSAVSVSDARAPGMTRWIAVGVVFGAGTAALVLGGVGALLGVVVPDVAAETVVGVVALAVVLREAGVLRLPLPANPLRIPKDVPDDDEWGEARTGFAVATLMRGGAAARLTSGLPYLLAVALLLVVPFGMAFVVAAGYAVGTIAGTAARPAGRVLVPAAGVRLLLALVCAVAVGVSMTISIGAS
ncbi:hypothetical protein [Pseudonocardia sp.]|uniref:hypothetical protein n=1 Tax=Pseudonocardia sp. TaxID=60912 RepID=UPI003D0AE487